MVPLFGGALAVLLGTVLTPPLEKRRLEFLTDLAERVEELAESVEAFRPEHLAQNEQFITATVAATQLADRTHLSECRQMLRNAAINSATTRLPDEEFLIVFRLLESVLPSEVRVLRFLVDPGKWELELGRGRSEAVDANGAAIIAFNFPGENHQVVRRRWERLASLDLVSPPPASNQAVSYTRIYQGFATKLGRTFFRFVSDPLKGGG